MVKTLIRERKREKLNTFSPVSFSADKNIGYARKKSRINSDICKSKIYPLNKLQVIIASYVVGITQYPVAVVIATPCTVLTEIRMPTVPDAAAIRLKSVPTSVLNELTIEAIAG